MLLLVLYSFLLIDVTFFVKVPAASVPQNPTYQAGSMQHLLGSQKVCGWSEDCRRAHMRMMYDGASFFL